MTFNIKSIEDHATWLKYVALVSCSLMICLFLWLQISKICKFTAVKANVTLFFIIVKLVKIGKSVKAASL
jgi:hypothetical protein